MDEIDRKIILALAGRARMTIKELASVAGLTSPSVTERLKRLEERGYIRGYTVVIDPKVVGYGVQAIVRMNPLPGALRKVERMIRETPAFVECDKVTGEDCFIARLQVRSVEELDVVLDRFHDHAQTSTAIVKSQPVERRLPPLFVESERSVPRKGMRRR
jgi:Lrp/AsnC family transcriptional regulator, leucine-responsive regulatory protein